MYSIETISLITFELSSHCNSKCPQCPRFDLHGFVQKDLKLQHLPLDVIKTIPLDKMRKLKIVCFVGNFGDPLMNPELDDIINYFTNQKIEISTNASLRNVQWWHNLGKKKNIEVTFCIDGLGDTHEIYRRNTSYKKIIENAKSFIQAGGEAIWQFIVFKHNETQIQEAEQLSKDLGFKEIKFMYSDRFDTNNKFKVFDKGNYLYDLEKSSKQTTLRERLSVDEGEKYWKNTIKNSKIICPWAAEQEIYVHSDSHIFPCCYVAGVEAGRNFEKLLYKKIIGDESVTNLQKYTLDEILNSNVFQKAIPESLNGSPFNHPICIETCANVTGKRKNRDLNTVNT